MNVTAPKVPTLAEVIADFNHLPPLPRVAMELMNCLRNDNASPEKVLTLLAQDQVLSAKTLRIANSSFYGLNHAVSNIHDAVTVLGLRTLNTLVTTIAIMSMFQKQHTALEDADYDQRAFWLHSVGTAFCARALAQALHVNPETAYSAGLLHDIGHVVLATRFPASFAQIIAQRNQRDCTLLEAEHTVLGFDHGQIGAALAQRWSLAPPIVEAITWHHAPEEQTALSYASIIHLADIMAHILNFYGEEAPLVPRLSAVVWNRSGLDWERFKQLLGTVEQQFQDADILFH